MSEPIKVGDMVMVIRGHVCDLGYVFTVIDIVPTSKFGGWYCVKCRHTEDDRDGEYFAVDHSRYGGSLLHWVKKIDPLAEPESTERPEEIAA